MSYQVEGIHVNIGADTSQLLNAERNVRRTSRGVERDFTRVERSGNRLSATMTRVAKAVGSVLAIRQLQRFIVGTAGAIDEQFKFAKQLDVTFESLQKLQFAAEQSGASITQLNNSLRRGSRNIADAANGMGSAGDAIEDLGFNIEELDSMRPDEQFMAIANAIREIPEASEQARIAYRLFGRDGEFLLNTLREGEAGLKALGDQAKASGRIISDEAARDSERFNDELNRMKGAARGAGVAMTADLIPAITGVFESLTEFISDGERAQRIIHMMGVAAQATAVILAGRFIASLTASIGAIRGVASAFALLGGPVGAIVVAAGAIALITRNLTKSTKEAREHTTAIEDMAREYKKFNDQQRTDEIRTAQLEIDALKRRRQELEIEKELAGIRARQEQVQGARRGSDAALTRATNASLENAQAQERLQGEIDTVNEYIEEFETRIGILTGEIIVNTDATDENTESKNRNNEQTKESVDVITNLAKQNEELRAAIAGTSEELEIRRAIQEAGVELGSAEANVIAELIRQNNALAESYDNLNESSQLRQDIEMIGLGDQDRQLLEFERQIQEQAEDLRKGLEQQLIDYEEYEMRKNALAEQYAEGRKAIIDGEAQTMMQRLQDLGFSFDQMANQGIGAVLGIAAGLDSGSDAARMFARTILQQAVGALARMLVQSIASQTGQAAAAATTGAAITAAYTPAAVAVNIASFGGAGLAAAQTAPIAATATTSAIQGARVGSGRLYGGGTNPGTAYPVNEDGRPELYMQGGRQWLLPSARGGQVISNRNMTTNQNGGDTFNLGGVTIQGGGMDRTQFENMLFDSENAIYELMQSARARRGES